MMWLQNVPQAKRFDEDVRDFLIEQKTANVDKLFAEESD